MGWEVSQLPAPNGTSHALGLLLAYELFEVQEHHMSNWMYM